MTDQLQHILTDFRNSIARYQSAIVAFSGGADSAFVLAVCREMLGKDRTLAVTACSPSLSREEREMAEAFAASIDAQHLLLNTDEMENESYTSNPANRCFFCKTELYDKLGAYNADKKFQTIVDGTNADDAHDVRPGRLAAAQHGVVSPLALCGWTKREIREASHSMNLRTWDKPAAPCLSSRIPYGQQVTVEKLSQIEQAERVLHSLGFPICRARHHDNLARIEVPLEDLPRLLAEPLRAQVERELVRIGFQTIIIDSRGFMSGGLNLRAKESRIPVVEPAP